jgi:hypothetical protein
MATLPSGLTDRVEDGEDLARFLTQSSQFNNSMAKPAAFLPNPKDRETSVSRHGSEPLETLWAIGADAAGGRTLHGAAIFKAAAVRSAHLDVLAERTAAAPRAIRGWPWDENDPELQKAKQKQMATEIASQAALVRR